MVHGALKASYLHEFAIFMSQLEVRGDVEMRPQQRDGNGLGPKPTSVPKWQHELPARFVVHCWFMESGDELTFYEPILTECLFCL